MRNLLKVAKVDAVLDTSLEQRRAPRHVVQAGVTFEGEGQAGNGRTSNVSSWGCAVESQTHLTPGTYVGVILNLPNETAPVEVELAAVRWTASRRFGVEFLSVSRVSRRRLDHFLGAQR